ncbi:MAG: sugar phosphate isomerase/epimerase [Bacilli bacterium]|nr:sugar phosphate isomerase/epimerase [Bacilli bacterium]
MNNKIGINIGGFEKAFKKDFKSYLPNLKKTGVDCLDVSLCDDWNKPSPYFAKDEYKSWAKEYKKTCDENGLIVNQTHAFFPLERAEYDWLIKELEKEIEATSILGAKYMVFHFGLFSIKEEDREKNFKLNYQIFKTLAPTLRKYGITGCLETLWENDEHGIMRKTLISTPEEILSFIDALGEDCYAVCVDTGHVNILDLPIDETIEKFGDKLKVLHINDNLKNKDSHLPMGFGSIDWRKVIGSLEKIGYNGVFNMELAIYNTVGKYDTTLVYDLAKLSIDIAKSLLKGEQK